MSNQKNIPDWLLERYLLKDLPDHEIQEINDIIIADKNAAKRIKKLESSNKSILKQYPTEKMTHQIMARFNQHDNDVNRSTNTIRRRIKFVLFPSILSAAAAVIFVFFFAFNDHTNEKGFNVTSHGTVDKKQNDNQLIDPDKQPIMIAKADPDTIRLRGFETKLYVYRKHDRGIELLYNRSTAKVNDLIQLAYAVTSETYGVIFSIDGRGNVTKHFPVSSIEAVKMKPGRKTFLSHSFQLDDAPNFERFFMVTSSKQFKYHQISSFARQLASDIQLSKTGKIPVGDSFKQVSILIVKPETD